LGLEVLKVSLYFLDFNWGSWFNAELNGCLDGNNKESSLLPSCNSLIWPARFHVNGVTHQERNITNDSEFGTKIQQSFGGL
jgi:hypothetical protein